MPSRRRHRPPLHVKVRLVPTRRMRKSEAFALARRTLRTRIVPEGLELAWVDWKRGHGVHLQAGEYVGDEAYDALADFMLALTDEGTRVAVDRIKPRRGGGESRERLGEW